MGAVCFHLYTLSLAQLGAKGAPPCIVLYTSTNYGITTNLGSLVCFGSVACKPLDGYGYYCTSCIELEFVRCTRRWMPQLHVEVVIRALPLQN